MADVSSRERFWWGFLVIVLASVAAGAVSGLSPAQRPLPGVAVFHEPVAGFLLTDQTGGPFGSENLRGKVWIADFIFTSCAGTCPGMTERMRLLQGRLPGEIKLVSISVDPRRDTPEALARYAKAHQADSARWHFLTGPGEAIQRLAREGFHLGISEGETREEPIIHSVRFALVDRKGALRGLYDASDPPALERLIADARALLRNS
ncbi:MAG: SCO family protein [Candidatus Omnitrophica bacterium]|nr:SCO family protein [Candidatus Omnitrophota bacterium]